jgi:hypothetical protein
MAMPPIHPPAVSRWPGRRSFLRSTTRFVHRYHERPESLRVFGRLPDTGVSKRREAGVRKASREETAGGVRTDAGVDLWRIYRRCLI